MKNPIAVLSCLLALALASAPGAVFAGDAPEPTKWEGVEWKSVNFVDYHAGKRERALELITDHFQPAGEATGGPGPLMLEMATGEWDLAFVWPMADGVASLNWQRSPQNIAWFQALVEREGGLEAAQALIDEYTGLIARSSSNLARVRADVGATPVAATMLPLTTSSAAARAEVVRGRDALDMGRNDEARAHFDRAIERDPAFAMAYLYRSQVAFGPSDWRKSLDAAQQHAGNASDAERMMIDMAATELTGDAGRRLEIAQQLAKAYPRSPRAQLILAGEQWGQQQVAASRSSMQRALAIDPDFAPAHESLAYAGIFQAPKDLALAESHARRLVELRPDEGGAYVTLGDVFRAANDLRAARSAYHDASMVNPQSATAFSKKGHADTFLGDYPAAREDFRQAASVATTGQAKVAQANFGVYTYLYAGDVAGALRANRQVLTSIDGMGMSPDEARSSRIGTHSDRALIGMFSGDYETAAKALADRAMYVREAAKQVGSEEWSRSREADIALWDGMLAAQRGDHRTARAQAAEYSRLVKNVNNPRKMEDYHRLLGTVEMARGRHAAALEHYRQADTDNPQVKYELALVHEGLGDSVRARELFREVADYNFNAVTYALCRGKAMAKLGGGRL